ncbi:hotdog family protein [Cupriavidus metallidurans]|uniref:hotdog family protein n=1 Tax=Cupriavidus TaxID=106589 RepID=UPI00257F9517|nr:MULTISPECIES: hotdog family protein [unclassified Cupriavidus]
MRTPGPISTMPPVGEVVPHGGAMRLIDELLAADDTQCVARATIRPTQLFVDDAGMPAWIGIEYMAQTIAAWAGMQARGKGCKPGPGFLLGSRRYASDVPAFPVGSVLTIRVGLEMAGDDGLSLFACTLDMGGQEVARATVSVYRPADAQAFLEGQQT